MNNQININSTTLSQQAQHIRQLTVSLNENLVAVRATINSIKEEWDSPAGSEYSSAFDNILPDFENAANFIKKYANFLDLTVESYEETEKRINQGASSFGS